MSRASKPGKLRRLSSGASPAGNCQAAWVFTAIAVLIWWLVRADYGISWDQTIDLQFGEAVRKYFSSGFDYAQVAGFPVANLKYYSPMVSLIAATLAKISGWDLFVCGSSVTGLFWVATFWPVCRIGEILGGTRAAWFAGLALLGIPVYMGHGFINAKDLPFACAAIWLLLAAARGVGAVQSGRFSFGHAIALGAAFGLVLAVRPGGWFTGILLGLPPAAVFLPAQRGISRKPLGRVAVLTMGALVLAWGLMVLPWPYAHQSPFLHPIEAMQLAGKFDKVYTVLFAGQQINSNALPWNYILSISASRFRRLFF